MKSARRRRVLTAVAGVFLVLGCTVAVQAQPSAASPDDVILLAREGISDETIQVFLDSREIGFTLGAEEIVHLREAGVSEEIIRYLLERAGTAPAEVPATRGYYYPSRYYATYYRAGASSYLEAAVLPYLWWNDAHFLHARGHYYLGHHHYGLAHYGLGPFGIASVAGAGIHHVVDSAIDHLGHSALARPANHQGAGHSGSVGHRGHGSLGHLSVGHRGIGHTRPGYSSRSHRLGLGGHAGGYAGHSGGSHGGGHGGHGRGHGYR